MVEPSVAAHRKFVGTACLYRHLASRPPPFLRRNLETALDRHAELLARSKSKGDAVVSPADATGGGMSANEKREAGWDYPTAEMLKDLLKGQRPMLRLDALQVRHGDASGGADGPRLHKIKSEPDWLPDPSIDFTAPCLVTLMFIDSGKDMNRQERIHVDTRCGTIESSTAATKQRVFNITLEDPFSIEVEKIYVTIERGSNGTYRWKRTIPAHYQLNVEIKCLHHTDAVHLLGLMEKKSASKYRGSLTEEDATLRATWYDLPECPPAGKLLTMTRTDGPDRSIGMKFGLELSMGWSRKKDSPLAAFAEHRRAALVPDQIQLPTPSASDESENTPKQQYLITWVFMNSRFHNMKTLKCPLCATAPSARAQHEFPSFDRLHTHVLMWHDHFQPRVEMNGYDQTAGTPGVMTKRYTIHMSLSSTPTEKMTQPKYDMDEDHWIAPEVPFDEQAYLRGEDTWTGHVRKVERAERPQISAAKKQPSSSGLVTTKRRPALADINDLPDLPKTKWPLPKVPRVRFYRTKSKRPFEPDENISESDESVDEGWLQAHKRDDMSSLPISAGGKEFYEDWNRAATDDDFPADLFTRECLVRFTRKHRGKMWDDEYYAEFLKTVNRLHELKLIDSEVQKYCSDRRSLVSDVPEQAVNGRHSHTAEGHRNGKQKATSNDGSGEATKTCSCGSPVMSARGAVTCHDIHCSRVQYHMACVGLSQRPENWQCEGCSTRMDVIDG